MQDPIEQQIRAKGLTAPRVTLTDVENEIVGEHYFTAAQGIRILPENSSLHRLTFCVLELRNGFTVTGQSGCVSPENFDAQIGCDIARRNAISEVWKLLGFRLADALAAAI